MASPPDGILLVDKPRGVTSFAVVNHVRRMLADASGRGRRRGAPKFRVGHAGTLDPLATGLLIILVGRGSRLSPFLLHLDKSYQATVRFGAETDTLDAEGKVVREAAPPESPAAVQAVLPRFRGAIEQVPPVYSALKRDGRTLHRLARSGQDVPEPEPRPVTIHHLEMTASRWVDDPHEADLSVDCSGGTYIRSLARDIGRAAGSAAHLGALRRTRIGPFVVDDAADVMDGDAEAIRARLLPLASALPHLPRLTLTAHETAAVLEGGQPLPPWLKRLEAPATPGAATEPDSGAARRFTLCDPDGRLVAVGEIAPDTGLPRLAAVVGRKET